MRQGMSHDREYTFRAFQLPRAAGLERSLACTCLPSLLVSLCFFFFFFFSMFVSTIPAVFASSPGKLQPEANMQKWPKNPPFQLRETDSCGPTPQRLAGAIGREFGK